MPKTKTDQLSLIIFHLNTRSLVKHYDELESQLGYLESPPDILCLTETWLKDNMTPYCFKLSGYKTLVSKTRPYRGGGVMIQCREAVKLVAEEQCNLDESLLIKVEANKNTTSYWLFTILREITKWSFSHALKKPYNV